MERGSSFRRWVFVTGGWLLAVTVVLSSGLPESSRAQVTSVVLPVTAVVAATSCLLTSRRSTGRRRRAWALLAAAGYIGFGGNAVGFMTGTTTTGDLAYIGALLIGVLALLSFPSTPVRATSVARMVLDGVVVGGSVLVVAAVAVFPDLETSAGGTTLGEVVALLMPIVDAVLATLAVVLITRSSRSERVPLVLVALSFVLYAMSDLSYALLGISAFTFGTPVDLGWITGYALGGLAARHPAATGGPRPARREESTPVAATILTFAVFLAAAVVWVVNVPAGSWNVVAVLLWLLVLVAVAARQTILVLDNERLRRGLERRVRARTAELRAVTRSRELMLSSVGDGIYGVDRDGRVTFVNPAGARTLGFAAREMVGQDAHGLFHAPGPDGAPFPFDSCYIAEAIRDGITASAEEDLYRRADGKDVPVEVTASPLRDGAVVLGAVVVFRDVTQRREVDRLKNEFVSVISHELRTPLTSIRGSLGLLAGGAAGPISDQARRMVTIALGSSERLTRLINDILEVERMEAGAAPIELADHDVRTVLAAAVDQVQGLADADGVSVRLGDVTGRVHADADRVVQTLINLLGNAIKFSARGSQVVVAARPAGEFVEFRVVDHGRGIPPDRLEMIFGRFEQVDSSDAREKGGTGLGLAISRSIVERHGGRIWAQSTPGEGSTFFMTLPRVDEEATTTASPTGADPVGR
ncbi:PAS/PAC sensor signal transduction histidine kinase [Beutenbergia cavernae DSM 12333]|uniref:histidine kinase n=1 Tax=Beutenbergia cavernae (strain ATCC BAA-8 / DSM 12333 / CCUG 43141 / JCM 11478 / NBRC 16432 / NCIMB 13614 / HKI 0122) TaxID=471853 RepID=C5BZE6_BEUC1|nr:ATP-binding protein [Beutenbergia cavernae]ACQ79118.1 PAS/PAC sensor signal transduction histidine kinase [Beutenbergia cavernae DSM 12333]